MFVPEHLICFKLADCVHQLKEDFSISKLPITDDNQVLQRFCAKLEYLLQYEMKGRVMVVFVLQYEMKSMSTI